LWIYTDTFTDVTHVADAPIHALAWSPDGEMIAAGYFGVQAETPEADQRTFAIEGGGLRLWSVHNVGNDIKLEGGATLFRDGSVYSIRFNADGSQIASLAQDAYVYGEDKQARDELQIHAVPSGMLLYAPPASITFLLQDDKVTLGANGLDWSASDQLAVIRQVDHDGQSGLSIIDTTNAQYKASSFPSIQRSQLSAVSWSPDGTQLAASWIDYNPMDSGGGLEMCYLDAQMYYPNGTQCINIRMFEATYRYDDVATFAWRPHSTQLAYVEGTKIRFWDPTTLENVTDLDAAHANVTMLAWKPDGSALLSAGSDYVVRLWTQFEAYQMPAPTPSQIVTLSTVPSGDSALSPDAQWIAIVTRVNKETSVVSRVDVYNMQDGSRRAVLILTDFLHAHWLRWSPDSSRLAVMYSESFSCSPPWVYTTQIWSAETGEMLLDLGLTNGLAWRPDSTAVVVGKYVNDRNEQFEIREVPSGKLLQTSPVSSEWGGHPNDANPSWWSPDGRWIAIDDTVGCGEWGGASVRVWDTERNVIAAELETWRNSYGGSGNSAEALAWSPDSTMVVVQGFAECYLYRLTPRGSGLVPELVTQECSGGVVFSPDSRYFYNGYQIIDTRNGWPVYLLRNFSGDEYRWVGDTLTGFRLSYADHVEITSIRTSDFLPQ
jgi:WD40 repeat protein